MNEASPSLALTLLLAVPLARSTGRSGVGGVGHTRFLVYPHLQKGFRPCGAQQTLPTKSSSRP